MKYLILAMIGVGCIDSGVYAQAQNTATGAVGMSSETRLGVPSRVGTNGSVGITTGPTTGG